MPVNSFENYNMSWKPDKSKLKSPFYISIATLLEKEIISASLPPHTMLPPQRELADFLDLNLSTITRAYKVCELKGLIYATTGKGTFVSPSINLPNVFENHDEFEGLIEMGVIKPFYETNSIIMDAMKSLTKRFGAESLLEYTNPIGTYAQKQSAKKWLSSLNVNASTSNILFASGAQNALTIALVSLFKPGAKIITDQFTHPNFISLANMLNIQLLPVKGDSSGMLPDELDGICSLNDAAGIYLMPNCSNPTNITMPQDRRKVISKIIKRHNLMLIEDDVYAFLIKEKAEPLFNMIPENSVYICSTSKSICAGLRVAFMAFPDSFRSSLIGGIYNINLKTSSFNIETLSELINDGSAHIIANKKIELAKARTEILNIHFPAYKNQSDDPCFFQWIPLPKGMNGSLFEQLAKTKGINVFSSDRFAVGSTMGKSYIRLAHSSPADIYELEKGILLLKPLLKELDKENSNPQFIV